ncbi:MAG: glycosyltransferase [Candidatus Moranbacteria bacterium]|nr:glycosyltransferase [Candidatus Moranbacteria bacterium]
MKKNNNLKTLAPELALVADSLINIGGAEMSFLALTKIFKQAHLYSLLFDPKIKTFQAIKPKLKSVFSNKTYGFIKKKSKYSLPFLAIATETLDLSNYDLVISSSSAFSKSLITKPDTVHFCYCHSPMRFAWDYTHEYLKELKLGRIRDLLAKVILNYLRVWDQASADRVDYFIANSQATRAKIKKYYRRSSRVIYPPAALNPKKIDLKSCHDFKRSYFLIVSRLSAYKKIDIAIHAFNKLNWPLKVVGQGPEYQKLKKIAGSNVEILGFQTRSNLFKLYQNCSVYVQPCEEDFGIAAVEAMSFGKPVLAYRAGGALETVIAGETGEFFDSITAEVIAEGAYRIKQKLSSYNPKSIQNQAQNFSFSKFQKQINQYIFSKYSNH